MKIFCQTIDAEISQPLTVTSPIVLASINPFLLMVNAPTGSFLFELKKGASVIFSKTFTSSDIKASLNTSDNYAYCFYPVIPDSPIFLRRGDYLLKITSSGYTKTDLSFMAWGQQHEDRQNAISYVITKNRELPLAFRVKQFKEGIEYGI